MNPETVLVNKIRDAIEKTYGGAFTKKEHATQFGSNGFPDLFVAIPHYFIDGPHRGKIDHSKRGVVLLLEVKVPGNKATPKQEECHESLRLAGVRVAVVTSVEEALEVIIDERVRIAEGRR